MGIILLITFFLWIGSFVVIIDYGTHTDEYGNDHTHPLLIFTWIFTSLSFVIIYLLTIGAL